MNELLNNPTVQAALVVAVAAALKALAVWIQKRFPNQAALVESNWCYLQPIVEIAMQQAQTNLKVYSGPTSLIVARSVTQFADSYRKLEGKEASAAEVAAAKNEIANAVARATGG